MIGMLLHLGSQHVEEGFFPELEAAPKLYQRRQSHEHQATRPASSDLVAFDDTLQEDALGGRRILENRTRATLLLRVVFAVFAVFALLVFRLRFVCRVWAAHSRLL